jgi:hypothetical protein
VEVYLWYSVCVKSKFINVSALPAGLWKGKQADRFRKQELSNGTIPSIQIKMLLILITFILSMLMIAMMYTRTPRSLKLMH